MGFELAIFEDDNLDAEFLEWLVSQRSGSLQRHFGKLWSYYANPMQEVSGNGACQRKLQEKGRCYVQAQESGLPSRITGLSYHPGGEFNAEPVSDIQRKEVVIENDIAWRINAMVDFLFGKPVNIVSRAEDTDKRQQIEKIMKRVFSTNGGIGFFRDMAVLGSVYGFVDCVLRLDDKIRNRLNNPAGSGKNIDFEKVLDFAGGIGLELAEAPRVLPILDENDYRRILYYVQHFYIRRNRAKLRNKFLSRLIKGDRSRDSRPVTAVTEIISPQARQRYEDGKLVEQQRIDFGFLPVVHIQNLAQPFYYEGCSDVEPLIPLQDELNTRLSDRASRITFQSFKMYLGKGIEGFENRPVCPGRMWYTDNPEAEIEEFGGDESTPSEDAHINEIREAMDKASAVTPLVAGVLKSKLGNLTSAVALKLTLMGTLSKTERKKFTYGEGIKQICRMVLELLDRAGIYHTDERERDFQVLFPSPLPENTKEKLEEAKLKRDLGVPAEQVLTELGYERQDSKVKSNK